MNINNKQVNLSIIIPAYNAAAYIQHTIDCVGAIGFGVEIIVVDDGSTDETYHLSCEKIAEWSNLKVITQKNAGVVSARNRGIEESHGRWIFFCDADDWVDVEGLQRLLYNAEKYGDDYLMMGAMNFVKSDGTFLHAVPDKVMLMPRDYLHSNGFQGSSCNHLFPAKLIQEQNIRFPLGVVNTEDSNFNIKAICCCKGIYSENIPIYNYNRLNESAAHVTNKSLVWRLGPLLSSIDILEFCKEHGIDLQMVDAQIDRLVEYFYKNHIYGSFSKHDYVQIIAYLKRIGTDCPKITNSYKYKALALSPRLGMMLLRAYNKIKYNS